MLRTPQLAICTCSWIFVYFSVISRLDTSLCESIRPGTIWCARMRHDHDWSISGDTLCHDLVFRSDLIRYVPIAVHDWIQFWQNYHDRGHHWGKIYFVQIRSDTFLYDPSRTCALCFDWIRLWARCFSRSGSRVITIWATIRPRRVYIQPDWTWTSLFLELLQSKHYNPLQSTIIDDGRSWALRQRDSYCILTLSPERKKTSSSQASHRSTTPNWLIDCVGV